MVKIQDHLNRFRWLRACGPPTGGLRPGLATAIYYIYMVLGLDVADPMGTPPGYRIGTLCTLVWCVLVSLANGPDRNPVQLTGYGVELATVYHKPTYYTVSFMDSCQFRQWLGRQTETSGLGPPLTKLLP